jgi:hypothetical protein
MNITSFPARQLTPDMVSRWHEILDATPQLAGPYFRPEFTAAAEVCAECEVAVLDDASQIVGFFPFQRTRWNVADRYLDRFPLAAVVRRGWSATRDWVKRFSLGGPARNSVPWRQQEGQWLGDTDLTASAAEKKPSSAPARRSS